MKKRTKKFLATIVVIFLVITAIWLVCHFVLPFLFNAFAWFIEKFLPLVLVIIGIIACFCFAIDS